MRSHRRLLVATLAVVMVVLGGGVANAAWNVSGSGSGVAGAGSLVVPSLTATRSSSSPSSAIELEWSAPGQLPGVTYEVKRDSTTLACTASPCTDSGLAADTSYSYVVTAKVGEWTATSDTATASTGTAATPVGSYALGGTNSFIAGASANVTIVAKREDGTTDTSYAGPGTITFSGDAFGPAPGGSGVTSPNTAAANPAGSTPVTFTAGQATVPVTLKKAGAGLVLSVSGQLDAAGSASRSGSTTVTVVPAAAARLAMTSTVTGNVGSAAQVSRACQFGCTLAGLGNNGTFTTSISVTDGFGNVVSNLGGAGVTVTVTRTSNRSGTVAPTTLNIPPTGPATSTESVTSTEGTASYSTTLTATGAYAQVASSFSK